MGWNFGDWPPEVGRSVPGVLGSLAAMRWMTGAWWQKALMFVGGTALSHYGTATLSGWIGIDAGPSGFLLGLFGMTLVAKVFEVLEALKAGDVIDVVKGWFGRPGSGA